MVSRSLLPTRKTHDSDSRFTNWRVSVFAGEGFGRQKSRHVERTVSSQRNKMELFQKNKTKTKKGGGYKSGYKLFCSVCKTEKHFVFISFVGCLFVCLFLGLVGSSGGATIVSFGWPDLRSLHALGGNE